VHQLIAELYGGVDWVLVEGFKSSDLLKVEVWRAPSADYPGKPALYPDDDFIVAVATDAPDQLPAATLRPVLDLDDAGAVAEYLVNNQERFAYSFEDRFG
jgi:molybdopterin-guanine dinucleotide biosynthesis protein B